MLALVIDHSAGNSLCTYTDFSATPSPVNATLGSTANFTCSISSNDFLFWLVNDTEARFLKGRKIRITEFSDAMGKTSTLSILSSKENNNSMIECIHVVNGGVTSGQVTLKVQGKDTLHTPLTTSCWL